MHILAKQRCRICGNQDLKLALDLGPQFLQGSFVKQGVQKPPQRKVPMLLVRCDVGKNEGACGLLQLAHSVPPEILYANYWYRSNTNSTMRNHLAEIAGSTLNIVKKPGGRVLDIGCNDGTLLAAYPGEMERWGVDPSNIARAIGAPIKVVNTVFPSVDCKAAFGQAKFDIVTSIAMFYDLEDPVGFAREIGALLAESGIWVLEMSYMPLMLKMNSFDTICHEHLEYYSLAVLQRIMREAGLRIFRVSLNSINGGSIRVYCCRDSFFAYDTEEARNDLRRLQVMEFEMALDTDAPYAAFQHRIEAQRNQMLELLEQIHKRGETVHVYGASTKGNVLLQWYDIDGFKIPYAADRNPDKHGASTLGTNIKIISEAESRAMKPSYYLVLPWHFKKEVLERERATISGGTKMIFPLPRLSIVDRDNIEEHIAGASQTAQALQQALGM